VLASLLVSVLMVGFKLNSAKEIVQTIERRQELNVNLSMVRRLLEIEDTKAWIEDVEFDTKQREDRIAELESASGQVYDLLEDALIAKGPSMFAIFEASSAGAKKLKHSALIMYSETKLDEATGLLFGRAAVMVRATPKEIVAHFLVSNDGHFVQSTNDPTVFVRSDVVEHANAHHTIVFSRCKATGVSDRTFLNSIVAKTVEEDPSTYMIVALPIAQHDKIARKDEKGAVRAENCRAFKLTEVSAGITKLEYACSLNLRGSIPQAFTNKVSVPRQMHGAHSPIGFPHAYTRYSPLGTTVRESIRPLIICGFMQCRPRCSDTFSRFGRSQSATPRTAGSSGTCYTISRAANRRICLGQSASLRTAQRCSASAASRTSATCSHVCSALMCKASQTVPVPFQLLPSQPQSLGSTPRR
jgi:hypothetical protein